MREAIVKELVGAVKEMAGNGYSVTAQETTKNNGVKMLGIEIRKPEETVVPRLYVDGIVDRVEDGFMTVEDAAKKVFEMYQNSETPEIEKLRQMVKEVNDNEVAPEEILGYEVYRYNRETGEVEVAA